MFKNKKGQVGPIIQDAVGLIALAFIMVIFFVVSSFYGLPKVDVENVVDDINGQIQDHYFVLLSLNDKINVDYNGKEHKISGTDLVRLSELDEGAKILLEEQGLTLEPEFYAFYIPNNLGDKIYVNKK